MSEWQPIETAPLAKLVLMWHPTWRQPWPGRLNGDDGASWIDTCEAEARGWQAHATHWMPLPQPPTSDS